MTTPSDRVLQLGPVRLLRYRSGTARLPVPVVLVPSIINRPTILDLRAGQSLAADLLGRGLDVYLLDWGTPRAADADLDLSDYGLRLIDRAVRAVRAESGADAAHLLGYCLGGTFALTAAARRVEGIASVVALTTPVDLSQPGGLGVLTDARLLRRIDLLARAWPIVPGPALWAAFQLLDPVGIGTKWRGFLRRVRDGRFRSRFLAQESWLADPVPVTAAALRQVVELYRTNGLARGTFRLAGRPVRLEEGTCPVLNLIASRDGIVPPHASWPLADLWGGPVTTREVSGGHIGVTVGSRAPENMWRHAGEWLCAHQPQEVAA